MCFFSEAPSSSSLPAVAIVAKHSYRLHQFSSLESAFCERREGGHCRTLLVAANLCQMGTEAFCGHVLQRLRQRFVRSLSKIAHEAWQQSSKRMRYSGLQIELGKRTSPPNELRIVSWL
jgi:hypothetical protein